jgi:hypothetical protein
MYMLSLIGKYALRSREPTKTTGSRPYLVRDSGFRDVHIDTTYGKHPSGGDSSEREPRIPPTLEMLKVRLLGFFPLNFQALSFILHLLMEVPPFVFYHPLEPVDPCFEDNHEGFLSDFVENVDDPRFINSAAQ